MLPPAHHSGRATLPRRGSDRSLHKRIPSMLFDIELDDSAGDAVHTRPTLPVELARALRASRADNTEVWKRAEAARERALDSATGEVDLARFAALLTKRGHRVWLRCSAQRGPAFGTKRLYTFCILEKPGGQLLIVDPHFSEQFRVAAAPDAYHTLLDLMPPIFVGTADHLNAVVSFFCEEIAQVFENKGLSCPQWRTKKAMLSKWLVSSATDVLVAP